MQSNYILASAILECLAFLINGVVLFLVLSRGRQKYHYLFAAVLALNAIAQLSFFLYHIRNSHLDELPIYFFIGQATGILVIPCIYHFTCRYLNQSRKKSTIFVWVYATIMVIFNGFGVVGGTAPMTITHTEWGNYLEFHGEAKFLIVLSLFLVISLAFIWLACWLLFRARRRETSPLARRHMQYIFISFLVISLLMLTLTFLPTKFEATLLAAPIRGLLIAAFGALIGVAIVKERLFDITVIIKKTTIYSILLALVIFIFSLSEHMLATYVGEFFGEHSIFIHIISIAVVIAILMPVRRKIERTIERFFTQKKVEF
jgi:hypothetical protein